MNAPNALSQDKTSAERKAYEPSMEEILASIRRIIADDQVLPHSAPELAPAAPVVPASAVEPAEAIAEPVALQSPEGDDAEVDGWTDVPAAIPPRPSRLAQAEPVAAPSRSGFDFVPGRDFRPLPPRAPAPERPAFVREPAAARPAQEPPADLRREAARRITTAPRPQQPVPAAAEEALVSPATDAMVSHAFNTLIASRFLQSNDAMGEMVRDMLRPMLKAWLDDNLPILVERLVRAEIERVARGGR
ncbi:hypothetical protein DES32_1955 [Methylovirgula ligni]|uniref:Cell pole-organizing protein PopZ n=2 Tax=Methylovirgula ligni TaxID=569860 RepID=A0A3D9YTT2_9HYPH|nr:DUF2497 domain-containing protein [Methylovirgula ligni]REF85915.1 hypothetical protein DES32_1955 [Methylovirgula ligni]